MVRRTLRIRLVLPFRLTRSVNYAECKHISLMWATALRSFCYRCRNYEVPGLASAQAVLDEIDSAFSVTLYHSDGFVSCGHSSCEPPRSSV